MKTQVRAVNGNDFSRRSSAWNKTLFCLWCSTLNPFPEAGHKPADLWKLIPASSLSNFIYLSHPLPSPQVSLFFQVTVILLFISVSSLVKVATKTLVKVATFILNKFLSQILIWYCSTQIVCTTCQIPLQRTNLESIFYKPVCYILNIMYWSVFFLRRLNMLIFDLSKDSYTVDFRLTFSGKISLLKGRSFLHRIL